VPVAAGHNQICAFCLCKFHQLICHRLRRRLSHGSGSYPVPREILRQVVDAPPARGLCPVVAHTAPATRCTSAATVMPGDSFTMSPGAKSAGMAIHAPSRRTDADSASRDFSALTVACARPSCKQTQRSVEHEEDGDDGSLEILSERQL
jgi:hypothetical protein